MALFEKIKDAAKQAAQKGSELAKTAGEKANEAIEIGKLNSAIRAEQNTIAQAKIELGEIIWAQFTAGDEVSLEAGELCEKIKAAMETIDMKNAEIAAIKAQPQEECCCQDEACDCQSEECCEEQCCCCEAPTCPVCGAEITADSRFCNSCGAKIGE